MGRQARAGQRDERHLPLSHDPAPGSGCASSPRSTSRSFGHGPKCQRRVSVAVSGECGEAGGGHRSLVDRRVVTFLEVAKQPARGDAGMPTRILARDQDRQLKRFGKAQPADLLRRRLGDEEVPALKCSAEDGTGMPLRGRRSSSTGPGRLGECIPVSSTT
jgi:hypothetical protein